jgi:hypothetical protein
MTPMGYAWLVLKAEEPPERELEPHEYEEPSNNRNPTPLDWLDPFRMTRPHMALALNQIREELERRDRGMGGGIGAENNPFFRHTRAEMRQAMQMMSDELERRGRPPISAEHFNAFDRGDELRRFRLPREITDEERMEYQRNFEREWNRPRRGDHDYRGRDYHSPPPAPSPEQIRVRNQGHDLDESTFDRDELMQRLMGGDILTEKELKFLQNPPEDEWTEDDWNSH